MKDQKYSLFIFTAAVGAAAAAFIATSARADDITIDNSVFTSSKTRAEVIADLKKPYAGGYPWSSSYKMTTPNSTLSRDEVRREFLSSRDEAKALVAEDSGSSYYYKRTPGRASDTTMMGGAPAR